MRASRSMMTAWDASSLSRRAALAMLALFVVAIVLWTGVRALSAAIARSESDVERTRAMLDVARAHVADTAAMSRAARPLRAGDVRGAVDRALAAHGLRAAPVAGGTNDGRYSIVVDDARFDALVAALDVLARDDGVRAVAATLSARVEPGRVRADLTFTR